nr:MAG TPA: hypothetical protein [Caudoviricetes sp.]
MNGFLVIGIRYSLVYIVKYSCLRFVEYLLVFRRV